MDDMIVLDTIFVPALNVHDARLAIEEGDWYSSPLAAESVADQFAVELGIVYKVYAVTFKEI